MLNWRIWKGISIASFVATGVAAFSMVVYSFASASAEPDLIAGLVVAVSAIFMTFVFGFPLAFLGCVFVGIPVHLALQKAGWTSPWAYLLAATIASTAFAWWAGVSKAMIELDWSIIQVIDVLMVAQLALGGPIVAATFLWVVRQR